MHPASGTEKRTSKLRCLSGSGRHIRIVLLKPMTEFKYAMNIHVLDVRGTPVPDAIVTISANGTPKARGRSRGYGNEPIKLRFNTECPQIAVKVEYKNEPVIEKIIPVAQRDVTVELSGVQMPQPEENGSKKRFAAENWAAFGFGILMLLVLFLSPIFLPATLPIYLTTAYPKILLTILSLSAAGFAAALTGFVLLEMGRDDSSYRIRAGGALAVFLIVFFWNPAGIN